MSNFDNLDDLLNTRVRDIAQTVNIPSGTWVWEVKAIKAFQPDNGKDGGVLFTLTPVEPCDDVDPEAFRAWNDQGGDEVVFYRVSGAVRKVGADIREMMKRIGMEDNRTPASLYGEKFLAHLRWDENKRDASRPWSRLTSFSPLPKAKGENEAQLPAIDFEVLAQEKPDDLPF